HVVQAHHVDAVLVQARGGLLRVGLIRKGGARDDVDSQEPDAVALLVIEMAVSGADKAVDARRGGVERADIRNGLAGVIPGQDEREFWRVLRAPGRKDTAQQHSSD